MSKQILVAPLNWGLGHAARCIPIINALISEGFEPIIASDGEALALLRKEFNSLPWIKLPSYNITYAKNGKYFKLKLIREFPKLLKVIRDEKKLINNFLGKNEISGIISDNRLGVKSKKVPSVFMTHQLNVLSGNTTWFSTKMHQYFINKFDVCWVPDAHGAINLSGKLGRTKSLAIPTKYIGPLSRFNYHNTEIKYDILVLISGPEPQRTLLEEKLFFEFKNYSRSIVFVKGIVEQEQTIEVIGNMTIYNFMTTELLEKTINESDLIISRSGYTTVMDLAKLNKKAFFIPTPGQYEQEYLANRLTDIGLVPSCSQDKFTLKNIEEVDDFEGLKAIDFEVNYKELFSLF
ncbi:MAG: glycosyltransferase [Flaviramulus sp.]|nr:glycosyltransferase [Flaviramulus sp.]NNC49076.1 glycosyltransferase [Flaviramulus sp.]